jgi:hypothetical protein
MGIHERTKEFYDALLELVKLDQWAEVDRILETMETGRILTLIKHGLAVANDLEFKLKTQPVDYSDGKAVGLFSDD